jgi:hypothetical protein
MLLAMFSVSQLGATGFVPNMFVAQKKLNKAVTTPTSNEMKEQSEVLNIKSDQQKENSKKSAVQNEKQRLHSENVSTGIESNEIESAASSLTRFMFKWIVSYLTMGRLA